MNVKTRTVYVCANCGDSSPKWSGKCNNCGEWNTLSEEIISRSKKSVRRQFSNKTNPILLAEFDSNTTQKISTNIGELDRVLGGGVVPGSVVLVAGDPGIGKSTLMLQMAAMASSGIPGEIIYSAGEESGQQIKMRADRIGLNSSENESPNLESDF